MDNIGDDCYGDYQVCVCLCGCLICWCINYLDCFNYFMKCVGKCGEGKFVCISWQEVLDIFVDCLKSVVVQYGNEVVYINYFLGIVGGNIICLLFFVLLVVCLMNCYGGLFNQYGIYSIVQIVCVMFYIYGSNDGNSILDIENSKLVVMFGNNLVEIWMSGGGIIWYLEQVCECFNV